MIDPTLVMTIVLSMLTLVCSLALIIFKSISTKVDDVVSSITDLNKNIATLIANDENKQREIERNREEIDKLRLVNHDINNTLSKIMGNQEIMKRNRS